MGRRLLGIDFSGAADQWKPRRRKSNVWIAFAETDGPRLRVDELSPVQALGGGEPFARLLALLMDRDLTAAIDAPFSLPRAHVASAALLWAEVAGLPADGRPFGRGPDLVASLAPGAGVNGLKLYRACEEAWREQGLNVRSTLWCGPRGGAAFAVACMTLLHRHKGPVWPFKPQGRGALIVEAYPAAQLKTWGLKPTGYNGAAPKAEAARLRIIEALVRDRGLRASDDILRLCATNADALDAVICAFAARTLAEGRHPRRLPAAARAEGWIVVDGLPQAGAPARPAVANDTESPLLSHATGRRIRRLFDDFEDALAAHVAAPASDD